MSVPATLMPFPLPHSSPHLPSRLALCVGGILVLWNRTVFGWVWGPFDWLVGYTDPRKGAGQDRLHGEGGPFVWGRGEKGAV